MNAPKKPVDWERIEVDYRAGVLSIREIASAHGISDAAIRKYAKGTKSRSAWTRDLSSKVKAKTEELVRTELVRTTVRTETATEREVVDATANAVAQIEISHRADVKRNRALAIKLMEELELVTDDKEVFEKLEELMSGSEDVSEGLKAAFRKAVSLPQRIDSMAKLANTTKVLVELERRIYKIDDGAGSSANDAVEALKKLANGE